MLKTIIYREFLSNIITFRFLFGLLVCVGLVGVNTLVLVQDYEEATIGYYSWEQKYVDSIHSIQVYSELASKCPPLAYKKPKLIHILNEGVERQVGTTTRVAHNRMPVFTREYGGAYTRLPVSWDQESNSNSYLAMFPKIDLALVFQVVISLLAFLFAYDAIAGEREDGTLALTLSNSISRSTLLLGKYLGGMLTLIVLLAISLLVALQILVFSLYAQLTGADWARIGVFFLVSLLYVSAFFTLGMLFSSITRRAATALMLAMFFWVIFVVVWPQASAFAVSQLVPLKPNEHLTFDGASEASAKGSGHLIFDLGSQVKREVRKFGEQHGISIGWQGLPDEHFDGAQQHSFLSGTFVGRYAGPPEKRSVFHEIWRLREESMIGAADELGKLQQEYLIQHPIRQAKLTQKVTRLSPAGVYANATAILSGTDLDSHLRFLDQARQYRVELIQYLHDQNAFGSEKWYSAEAFSKTDKESIPLWHENVESLGSSLRRTTPDLLILIGLNAMFFLLTFTVFLRYDAR